MSAAPVSVIGLGVMGSALADAMLAAGHPTTVWNRTASKSDELVTRGAHRAGTVAAALAASRVVVVCVLDNSVAHQLLDEAAGEVAGRTIVNLTNGTPAQARHLAAWVGEHGGEYLDGGIMATPPMIGGPDAYVLYSGQASALERVRPVLERFGGVNHVGEDPGLAALYDLALLSGMYGMLAGWFQSFAMVTSEGVAAGEFATLLGPWLQAMATYLTPIAEEVDAKSDLPDDAPLPAHIAALANIATAGAAQGVRADLLAPLRELFERAAAAGKVSLAGLVDVLHAGATAGRTAHA
jgi:3-hydroxyisobutyrate dehydrogenase-like beta-hydroxyacid dehydrogenase